MPREVAPTLLQAMLGTTVGEDALTDGLCYLLVHDGDFAALFAEMSGLDAAWTCAEARTQIEVRDGRVDLEVVLARGSDRHLLWVEAKTFTTEHGDQLDVYAAALDARKVSTAARGADIVVLAPLGNPIIATAQAKGYRSLSWQQVLTTLVLIAERRGGSAWRERAESSDCPSGLRDLFDYCWRLCERGVAVDVKPLEHDDAKVAARAETLLNPHGVIGALLDHAADHLKGFACVDRYAYPRGPVATTCGRTLAPTGGPIGWPVDRGSVRITFELWFSTSDQRACARTDVPQPGFLAGMVVQPIDDIQALPAAVKQALQDSTWQDRLPLHIRVGEPVSEQRWLVGTLPVSDLGRLQGIDTQMSHLRDWTATTIADVLAIEPPPTWSPVS